MDLADIPAAAAFLGTEGLSGSDATLCPSSSTGAAAAQPPPSAPARLHDLSGHSGAMSTNPHASAAAAAALLGAAHFYPAAAGPVADANAAMAHQYYTQHMTGLNFMPPMYGLNMFPQPPPPPFLNAYPPTTSGSAPPHAHHAHHAPHAYDMDPAALQHRIAAQFTHATPEQQTAYYEDIRQQLDHAVSGLDEKQKQVLLSIDPSLSFSMKPLDLDAEVKPDVHHPDAASTTLPSSRDGAGGVKRSRTSSSTPAAAGATKKAKRSKAASSCEPNATKVGGGGGAEGLQQLLNEESPEASSSSTATPPPRATPRGRPPGKMTTAKAAGGPYELTPSGKRKSMTPQAEEMRARKAKMTWPKGTFIIRLQDVKVRSGRDHIWLVDNHQLLQRYNNESGVVRADGSRVYHRTDRYTGWLCHEGFHYFPLYDHTHILRQEGETVTVMFPLETELRQAIEYEEQEKARRTEIKEEPSSSNRLPLPPSIRSMQQQPLEESASMTSSMMMNEMPSSSSTMTMMRDRHRDGGDHDHDHQTRNGKAGGGAKLKRRSTHPVYSASPSCSATLALLDGDGGAASTSRHGIQEMPSLMREDCWADDAVEAMMGGVYDDVIATTTVDDPTIKEEEVDYGYEDLTDLTSGML